MNEVTFRTTYSSGNVYEESVDDCNTAEQYANRHFGTDYATVQENGAKIEVIAINGQTPPQEQPQGAENEQDPELQHEQSGALGEQEPVHEGTGGVDANSAGSTSNAASDGTTETSASTVSETVASEAAPSEPVQTQEVSDGQVAQ